MANELVVYYRTPGLGFRLQFAVANIHQLHLPILADHQGERERRLCLCHPCGPNLQSTDQGDTHPPAVSLRIGRREPAAGGPQATSRRRCLGLAWRHDNGRASLPRTFAGGSTDRAGDRPTHPRARASPSPSAPRPPGDFAQVQVAASHDFQAPVVILKTATSKAEETSEQSHTHSLTLLGCS